jgi:hypothetical protein
MTIAGDVPALDRVDPTVEVTTVRVATWNIHDAVGRDGQRDWARVARVIASLDAPIVGLQEVACGSGDACDVQKLAAANGCVWRAIPTPRPWRHGHYIGGPGTLTPHKPGTPHGQQNLHQDPSRTRRHPEIGR